MSKKEQKEINWFLLGSDVWKEVFSWLLFPQVKTTRLVCKQWNEWILEHSRLWPFDPKIFYYTIKKINQGVYKHQKIKLDKPYTIIKLDFDLGILVSTQIDFYDYNGFSIYSKETFKLLYSHEDTLTNIQC